jgi:hypothetical protein
MVARLLLLVALAASPLAAQVVEALPPRPLAGGPLAPRPVEPPPVVVVDPFADSGPSLVPAASADEGLFFDSEVAVVIPTLTDQKQMPAPVRIPRVDLDTSFVWAGEVGYRLPDGQGLFAVGYKFLNAEGTGDVVQNGIPYSVRTRASVNALDIDYGAPAYEFAPRYTVAWRVGGRVAGLYFDSRGQSGNYVRQASNYYFGSGAHGRIDLERRVALVQGLSLFGRLDGAVLVGQVQQRSRQELNGLTLTFTDRDGRTMPVVSAQAGLSYAPPGVPGLKITAGYLYEEWFKAGSLGLSRGGTIGTSQGGLMWHGPFLRGQFDF